MNLQEAVCWLLENNALPFQSTANYAGGVEIAMSTLINPSPAKVRVGSIIFFADSKVSTVVGVTSNSFIVSDQYNDLVDDVVYVSNVAINASGHLIVTLSNSETIDAGLIKQVTGFSINGSQHLIVTYNDSSTTDLGAIFSGNVSISGNLTVSGGISGNAITGNSIIENMSGYSMHNYGLTEIDLAYVGACKNGNKITFAVAGTFTRGDSTSYNITPLYFIIPSAVGSKLFGIGGSSVLDIKQLIFFDSSDPETLIAKSAEIVKNSNTQLSLNIYAVTNTLVKYKPYKFRYEVTFLLGDNLAS